LKRIVGFKPKLLQLDDNDKAILKKLLEETDSKSNDSELTVSDTKLPLERIEIDLKDHEKYCHHCSNPMHQMGEEICSQIEYVEPSLKHRKIVRLKYACRHCELEVKVPKKPGRKGKVIKAGPGLLAYLIVAEYADHLPLYRLEGIFSGILQAPKIHTDDTTLPVQDRTLKGRTRQEECGYIRINLAACMNTLQIEVGKGPMPF
jgi:hypothetical protein